MVMNIEIKQIILTLILTFSTTTKVIACDCPLRPDTKEDFESEWKAVETVLELRIIEVLKKPEGWFGTKILKAKILKIHKGKIETKTIKIYTEMDGGGSCEYDFKLGESYLFYGNKIKKENYYHTSICHRTGKLSERKFDLKMLKEKQ